MDLSKMTQKTQEALQAAQSDAVRRGHQEVDGEHLLAALLDQSDGLASRLLARMGVSAEAFRDEIESELDRRPKVSGGGMELGKVYITAHLQELVIRALPSLPLGRAQLGDQLPRVVLHGAPPARHQSSPSPVECQPGGEGGAAAS